jgi:membrane protein implicated in regulation of membrane protease activity
MDILWWHWLVLGLILAVAEMATAGGFYIIFFGIGAIIVGTLAAFGLAGPMWMQLLLFSALSIAGLVLFRGRVLRTLQPNPRSQTVDQLVGEVAVATEDIAPGAVGRVELRGAAWSARVVGGGALVRGARCRVKQIDGLMLHVEPEGAR